MPVSRPIRMAMFGIWPPERAGPVRPQPGQRQPDRDLLRRPRLALAGPAAGGRSRWPCPSPSARRWASSAPGGCCAACGDRSPGRRSPVWPSGRADAALRRARSVVRIRDRAAQRERRHGRAQQRRSWFGRAPARRSGMRWRLLALFAGYARGHRRVAAQPAPRSRAELRRDAHGDPAPGAAAVGSLPDQPDRSRPRSWPRAAARGAWRCRLLCWVPTLLVWPQRSISSGLAEGLLPFIALLGLLLPFAAPDRGEPAGTVPRPAVRKADYAAGSSLTKSPVRTPARGRGARRSAPRPTLRRAPTRRCRARAAAPA